jgi:hypothetical protein
MTRDRGKMRALPLRKPVANVGAPRGTPPPAILRIESLKEDEGARKTEAALVVEVFE